MHSTQVHSEVEHVIRKVSGDVPVGCLYIPAPLYPPPPPKEHGGII